MTVEIVIISSIVCFLISIASYFIGYSVGARLPKEIYVRQQIIREEISKLKSELEDDEE